MRDERGIDYGLITGIGVAIASAVVLLAVFAAFRSAAPAGDMMALESIASMVSGDIDTVSALGIPFQLEKVYDPGGADVYIGADHVLAVSHGSTFTVPLACRVCPGLYEEGGEVCWNDTRTFREYLNATLGATGTDDHPLRSECLSDMYALLERSTRSMSSSPLMVKPGRSLVIEKLYVYHEAEREGGPSRDAHVFVYYR